MNIDFISGLKNLDVGNNPTLQFDNRKDFINFLAKLKKLRLDSIDIDQECIAQFDGLMEIIKKIPQLTKINGESKEFVQKQLARAKSLSDQKN